MNIDSFNLPLGDFGLFGEMSGHQATEVHLALQEAGFSSRLYSLSTSMWAGMANRGDSMFMNFLKGCRIPVFFFSESNARKQPIYTKDKNLINDLMMTLIVARQNGPIIVVVVDGQWPLSAAPEVHIVPYPKRGTATLVASLFRTCGISLFARKQAETRRDTIASIYRQGLSNAVAGQELQLLIFGPGQPVASELDSFEGRMWQVRESVRKELTGSEVLVVNGEELTSIPGASFETRLNPSLRERLFAGEVDVIVILAASIGSATELGVFSQHPTLCEKMIIFVCEEHEGGFMNTGAAKECANHRADHRLFKRETLFQNQLDGEVLKVVFERLESIVSRRLSVSSNRD